MIRHQLSELFWGGCRGLMGYYILLLACIITYPSQGDVYGSLSNLPKFNSKEKKSWEKTRTNFGIKPEPILENAVAEAMIKN
jgi:hypothetical protein